MGVLADCDCTCIVNALQLPLAANPNLAQWSKCQVGSPAASCRVLTARCSRNILAVMMGLQATRCLSRHQHPPWCAYAGQHLPQSTQRCGARGSQQVDGRCHDVTPVLTNGWPRRYWWAHPNFSEVEQIVMRVCGGMCCVLYAL